MKKIVCLLAIASVLFMPAEVWSQHRHHRPQPMPNPAHHQGQAHHPAPGVYMRPDCPPCASPEQMGMVMRTLQKQSSDDKKLEIADLCVTIGYFCTDDLARMASLFSFDDKRLDFLRYAYAYCTDKENYPFLRNCFTFSSNYDELMNYIYPDIRR